MKILREAKWKRGEGEGRGRRWWGGGTIGGETLRKYKDFRRPPILFAKIWRSPVSPLVERIEDASRLVRFISARYFEILFFIIIFFEIKRMDFFGSRKYAKEKSYLIYLLNNLNKANIADWFLRSLRWRLLGPHRPSGVLLGPKIRTTNPHF